MVLMSRRRHSMTSGRQPWTDGPKTREGVRPELMQAASLKLAGVLDCREAAFRRRGVGIREVQESEALVIWLSGVLG